MNIPGHMIIHAHYGSKIAQPLFRPLAAATFSRTSFSVKTLTSKASVYEIRSEWVKRLQFLVNIGERIVSYPLIRILVRERRPRALNTYQMLLKGLCHETTTVLGLFNLF